jgi:hypothetical protein
VSTVARAPGVRLWLSDGVRWIEAPSGGGYAPDDQERKRKHAT